MNCGWRKAHDPARKVSRELIGPSLGLPPSRPNEIHRGDGPDQVQDSVIRIEPDHRPHFPDGVFPQHGRRETVQRDRAAQGVQGSLDLDSRAWSKVLQEKG
jgi:hypothetical protein